MSKKEEININDNYEYPKPSKVKRSKEDLYKENADIVKREINLDITMSSRGQLKEIEKSLEIIKTKGNNIITDFLLLKLYRLTANKDEKFNLESQLLEKYINKFRTDLESASKCLAAMLKKTATSPEEIEDVYETVESLYGFHSGLRCDVNIYKKKYFHEFKLSSHSIIRNKMIEEVEDLIVRVETELRLYKSIEEANDYYIYNSGTEITEVINELLKMKKDDRSILNYHYFIPQDAIIAFKYTEWIELFIKFNYVLGKLGTTAQSTLFKTKYQALELRYTIISIYNEMHRG